MACSSAPDASDTSFSLGSYYGRILALPLGRPNAVLLVGTASTSRGPGRMPSGGRSNGEAFVPRG